ncbi:hypothetical protein [uncultured Kordia sp.]|uniref:hypothetical protein n=1 Tax=uncultured Kordia sp. TaxID=507699 RepID=UPI002609DD0C|nr:hypothetical protein [uncultured Kordia sp.]
MRNPTRRNRNIGTAKQGFGQNNKLVVPYHAEEMKFFYEKLGEYTVVERIINNHRFKFIIEKTRENSFHACTIDDLEIILSLIPKKDYGDLELIILRQPTRKEENLKPVWGRLIYSYEFENEYFPAIIIEAIDLERSFKWPKKLSVDGQKELERLKEDGHNIVMGKRYFEAEYKIEHIRATQLYRTLPHEFGHYVHYLNVVERSEKPNEEYDAWEKRWNAYHSLPTSEKESFAHSYADTFKSQLEAKYLIPFDRILDLDSMKKDGLKISDFE